MVMIGIEPNLREKILIKQSHIDRARKFLAEYPTLDHESRQLIEHDIQSQESRRSLLTEQLNARTMGME